KRFPFLNLRLPATKGPRHWKPWRGALLLTACGWGLATTASASPKNHWSYQPVHRPAVPSNGDSWARGDIDEFILAALREKHLAPAAEADRRTLIRRLYLVAHGLPPSPGE